MNTPESISKTHRTACANEGARSGGANVGSEPITIIITEMIEMATIERHCQPLSLLASSGEKPLLILVITTPLQADIRFGKYTALSEGLR